MADNLGIAYDVVLRKHKAVVDTMKPVIGGTAFDATEENIQARLHGDADGSTSKMQVYLLNSSNKTRKMHSVSVRFGDAAGCVQRDGRPL